MSHDISHIKDQFKAEIATVTSASDLEALEIKYLGRKNGLLTNAVKELKNAPKENIATLGQQINLAKAEITQALQTQREKLAGESVGKNFDITLPGTTKRQGHLHLMTTAIAEISEIFARIGFKRVRHPEVDWDYYAFESLNMPSDHPARDEWETFFIDREPIGPKGQRVLIPHTSNGQVREMELEVKLAQEEKRDISVRMINIAKCYRRQIDASHTPVFHQFEGLFVDKNITVAHLKGTLDFFVKNFFGQERVTRLRPYHFQFTEPSFEIDINCSVCLGSGCKLCKAGWLELGGAGMVHPNVLKAGGIDSKKYSGFAFGWGVERTYLMKSGINIDDLRILYKNDVRFLEQF